MPAFILALIGSFLATLGGRGQHLMAHLSVALRQGGPLLFAGLLAAAVAALAAAYVGVRVTQTLPPAAALYLLPLVLLMAAAALIWQPGHRSPAEPTRSLFAITSVLTMRQLAGAAGLLLAAVALASGEAVQVAAGGALGSGAALALCWVRPQLMGRSGRLQALRLATAALLAATAVWTALAAAGIV